MTIGAYLGVAGLVDVGYRFYTSTETAVAARVTAGITDAGDGWYSASVTLPSTSASVRWDSTGTAEAKAREYWSDPWGNPVPNGYPSGTAGYVLGTNLDATVSSRATPAQVNTEADTALADVGLTTTVTGRIDATVSSRATPAQVATELTTYGALKPTVAARTLDVSTTGEAGVDWANVGSPTTVVGLSGTTIKAVTDPVTLTSAYDAAKTAATQASVNTIDDFVDTEVAAIKATTDKLDTALELDGAVYRYTTNALEQAPAGGGGGGDASQATLLAVKAKTDALPTDPADASDIAASFATVNSTLATLSSYVDTEVAAIKAKTDALPSDPADASDVAASFATVNTKLDSISTGLPLDATELNAIADALLKRDWTLVTGEASRSMLNALRLLRNKWTTVETANTLTVKKEDDSTSAWTAPLTTDATAAPITSMDPV